MFYPDPFYGGLLLINGSISLFVAIFIFSRDFKSLLNKLMGTAFIGFSTYLTLEGVIYVSQIEDIVYVNLLRDLSLIGVMVAATFLLFAAITLHYGEFFYSGTKKSIFFGSLIVVNILATIFALMEESITFSVVEGVKYLEFEGSILSIVFSHLYPIIMILASLILFGILYKEIRNEEKILALKILYLMLGMFLVLSGAIWMSIIRLIFVTEIIPTTYYFPGHILYFVGGIVTFWGFRLQLNVKKVESEPE